ncbi:hypothetical protein D3C84_1193900 [compost metagenome]
MKASATAADKDEFCSTALDGAIIYIAYFQFPRVVAGTFDIINIMLEFDINVFTFQVGKQHAR